MRSLSAVSVKQREIVFLGGLSVVRIRWQGGSAGPRAVRKPSRRTDDYRKSTTSGKCGQYNINLILISWGVGLQVRLPCHSMKEAQKYGLEPSKAR